MQVTNEGIYWAIFRFLVSLKVPQKSQISLTGKTFFDAFESLENIFERSSLTGYFESLNIKVIDYRKSFFFALTSQSFKTLFY